MPKFGPPKQTGYDPFNAISNSLAALADPSEEDIEQVEDIAPQPVETQPEPEGEPPRRPLSAQPLRHEVTAPPPRVVSTPRREVRHEQSSGGAQVHAVVEPRPQPVHPRTPADQLLNVTKRIKTTRNEGTKLDHAALKLSARLGVSVDVSKLTRALWEIYLRYEEDIIKQAPADAQWDRPSNQDAVGLAELDQSIAELIENALLVASMRQRSRRQ